MSSRECEGGRRRSIDLPHGKYTTPAGRHRAPLTPRTKRPRSPSRRADRAEPAQREKKKYCTAP